MPSLQPAVRSIYFNVPAAPAPGATSWLDLSLAASAINRRMIRQGKNWAVAGFTFYDQSTAGGSIQVSKLPDSWSVANAWTKSFHLWRRMQDQVVDDNPSIVGRYNDFKVYAEDGMVNATIQATWYAQPNEILMPISGPQGSGQYVLKYGSWDYSDITIPNDPENAGTTKDYALHMIGPDLAGAGTGSKGMLQGYGESRSRPADIDPNTPGLIGWMTELFDVGEQLEEVQDNVVNENDSPPYRVGAADPADVTHGKVYIPGASENLPVMEIHSALSFTPTTVSAKQQIGGTNVQCGLIKLVTTGFTTSESEVSSNLFMQVHLVPGPHRGYMLQDMQDVN
jgi:hypothetical protein